MDKVERYLAPLLDLLSGQPWMQAVAIILSTFLLASILSWAIFRFLKLVASKSKSFIDEGLIVITKPLIYYSLLITGFSAGIRRMPLSDKFTDYLIYGLETIGAIIWMIVLIRLSKIILQKLAWSGDKARVKLVQPQTLPLFDNLLKLIIFAMTVYVIFKIWGIDMTAWLASAGIVGIAVGFAAKDTLANLFSGVFILADSPYKIGDYVVLDGNLRGKVTHIGLRSTRLLTRDDVEVTIPNSVMGNSKVINQSGGANPKFRIRVKIGVAYGTDIDKVENILMAIAEKEPMLVDCPEPRLRFRQFGGSSLDFELLGWIEHPELQGRVLHSLNCAIYKAFNEQKIEIPYAKQDLYIKEIPNLKSD